MKYERIVGNRVAVDPKPSILVYLDASTVARNDVAVAGAAAHSSGIARVYINFVFAISTERAIAT